MLPAIVSAFPFIKDAYGPAGLWWYVGVHGGEEMKGVDGDGGVMGRYGCDGVCEG